MLAGAADEIVAVEAADIALVVDVQRDVLAARATVLVPIRAHPTVQCDSQENVGHGRGEECLAI